MIITMSSIFLSMKLPQNITKSNYSIYCKQFSLLLQKLKVKNDQEVDSTLHQFSLYLQQTFPDELKNLDDVNDFFTGEKASSLIAWYSPLIDTGKTIKN